MGKQVGPAYITGTVGDRTYYKLNGQYLVRAKSTLSRRRVKRSPAFQRTMEYAGWLAQASKVASEVYRMITRERRKVEMYRAMTGMAMSLIKQGIDKEMVKGRLIQAYVRQIVPIVSEPQRVVVRPHKVVRIFSTSVIRKRAVSEECCSKDGVRRWRRRGTKAGVKSGVG